MGASVTIDISQVMKNLKQLEQKAPGAAKKAKAEVGDELLRLSQKEVPHDEGTLANSGVSESDGDDHVVSYNTAYAARLHEHPEYSFQAGRKGKYLEDPIKRNQKAFQKIFEIAFARAL